MSGRFAAAWMAALFFLQPAVAAADVGDFVGKTIATVTRDRWRTSDARIRG